MAWQPVPLAGGHYADNARPWANQEVVNWLPVKPERPGTRSELMLRDVPGLRPFSVVGTGPIRGAHNAEGTLFVVSGTGLYRISPLGVASSLGTIPGVGRVSMAHNQVTGGNQVVIANGSAAYVYDTTDDTLTQITDEGFPGAKSVRFLGQMILYVEPFGRFWGSSDLADATSYNTIFRQEAEGSPDLILHVEPSQGEALVFGKRTIEVWSNQVTENANFQRTTVIERGAASQWAIVTLDNSCIFLGDDGIVYRLNGYTPVPISTRPLEFGLADFDLSKAFAFTWEDRGFKVAYFSIPGGLTWGYDVATGEWHRRESTGLGRWRVNALAPFARKWIGGDYADGTLWELDWDWHKEGDDDLVRICRPPMMHNGGNRVRVNGLRLEVDMGEAGVASDELPPVFPALSISGDMPDGFSGNTETGLYTVAGGVAPLTVAVTAGTFPAGLTLASDGSWSGTRTTTGSFSWTVTVTDADGRTATLDDTSVTGIAPPTVIMGDHAYSGNVGSLSYAGASPLVSFCNGVMPVASDDGLIVAGRAQASAVLGIYEYNMVSGLYSAATITGTKPDLSGGSYIQMLAMSADGERIYALSTGSANIYTLERTGPLAFSVVQTFASGLIAVGSTGGMTAIVLAPDGDRLAVSVENGRVRTYTIDAAGALTLESTSADGTVNGNCFRLDWVGRYIAQDDIHATGTLRVMDADDGLAIKGSIINSGRRLLGFNADATYLYTVVNSGTYALAVHAFDGSALAAGNTYATNKQPFVGSRLSPSRGTLLYLEQTNTDGNLYAVGGAILTAGEVLTNGFSNGFWSNPGRAP